MDEVETIRVVLGHACADGEDVGVEDDVVGVEANGEQEVIRASTDTDLAIYLRRLGDRTRVYKRESM